MAAAGSPGRQERVRRRGGRGKMVARARRRVEGMGVVAVVLVFCRAGSVGVWGGRRCGGWWWWWVAEAAEAAAAAGWGGGGGRLGHLAEHDGLGPGEALEDGPEPVHVDPARVGEVAPPPRQQPPVDLIRPASARTKRPPRSGRAGARARGRARMHTVRETRTAARARAHTHPPSHTHRRSAARTQASLRTRRASVRARWSMSVCA